MSQFEKIWRRKSSETPPPTNVNQSMPPPGLAVEHLPHFNATQSIEIYQSIETENE